MEQCPFFLSPDSNSSPLWSDLESKLSSKNVSTQISGFQELIKFQVSGYNPPNFILTSVVNNISGTKDHTLQKLLFLYFEFLGSNTALAKDEDAQGQILMTTNNLLKLIDHPNEYIRSAALRFASRFQDPNVIGPLIPKIQNSLSHSAAYVRRHAVVAYGRIYQRWPDRAQDAPKMIFDLLSTENDPACRRVAFLLLCEISPSFAGRYLSEISEIGLLTFPEAMQLTAASLMKTLCTDNNKAIYLPALFELLSSPYPGVQLEAAHTMLKLTSSFAAAEAGLTTLSSLMQSVPITSLQLSIVYQIDNLLSTHSQAAQKLVTDFLPALQSKPVREPLLKLVQKIATPDNSLSIIKFLITELTSANALLTKESEKADATSYAHLLLDTMRIICKTNPSVKEEIDGKIKTILQIAYNSSKLFWDKEHTLAFPALQMARDLCVSQPECQKSIANDLMNLLELMTDSICIRDSIFLISLFCQDPKDAISEIVAAFKEDEEEQNDSESDGKVAPTSNVAVRDGTYVQVDTTPQVLEKKVKGAEKLNNDCFLIVAIMTSVARICVRFSQKESAISIDQETIQKAHEFLDYMTKWLTFEQSQYKHAALAQYAIDHPDNKDIITSLVEKPYSQFIFAHQQNSSKLIVKPPAQPKKNITLDSPLSFTSLLPKEFEIKPFNQSSQKAPNFQSINYFEQEKAENEKEISEKAVLHQLTGPSDSIFVECKVISKKYEVLLELRFLNQKRTMENNISLNLYTIGALKLVDKPVPFSIPVNGIHVMKLTVKVTSAEAGKIYGHLSFTSNSESDSSNEDLPLAPLSISIADFMTESTISPLEFREKWEDFGWEKKISINWSKSQTQEISENKAENNQKEDNILINQFLDVLTKAGKMNVIVRSMNTLQFLTANVYSKSVFGEEVLANVKIQEKNGVVTGFVRLRTTSQPIAISFAKIIYSLPPPS